MNATVNITALSYWFPLIEAAGFPVPKTHIVAVPKNVQAEIWGAFDGNSDCVNLTAFAAKVGTVGDKLGYPLFLLTDFTSSKHNWERTCHVTKREALAQHIYTLAEDSEMMDMMGLPWNTLVLREMLPTIPKAVCPRYRNMPVCREFRFFVENGTVKCWHPYWPEHALQKGGVKTDTEFMVEMGMHGSQELAELSDLAERVSRAVPGAWSVDILETKRGWFVTDMAEAHKSFHWEGCDIAKEFAHG
jgi:hypothetical protein